MKFLDNKFKKSIVSLALVGVFSSVAILHTVEAAPYVVAQGSTYLGTFNSFNSARIEATKWHDSFIQELPNYNIVWWYRSHFIYSVHQGNKKLGDYETFDEAIKEAIKWKDSYIKGPSGVPDVDQHTIWNYWQGLYKIYQKGPNGDISIGSTITLADAIKEAKKYDNSYVQYLFSNKNIWSFYEKTYSVYQGNYFLGNFDTFDQALREAKKWANSYIKRLDMKDETEPLWSFGQGMYKVVQDSRLLATFDTLEKAIREGKKWDRSYVRYTPDNNIVWQFPDKLR